MEAIKSKCCKTGSTPIKAQSAKGGPLSLLSTALLILLPKCPLCFTAYLSAAGLFIDVDNKELAPFLLHAKPLLGVVILIMILLNRRGKRTLISLAVCLVALTFLILQTYFMSPILPDWIIYTAFVMAIWYNGNFQYFFRFVRYGTQ